MSLTTLYWWLKQTIPATGRPARRTRPGRRQACRLWVEPLEDRRLLSNFLLQGLPPGEPIISYVGVGFVRNEVAILLAPQNLTQADYDITIDWGNGTSDGELADLGPDPGYGESYAVKGSNVYGSLTDSTDTIKITITPKGQLIGTPQSIDANPTLYDMPSGIPGQPPQAMLPVGDAENVSLVVQPMPPGDDIDAHVGDTNQVPIGGLYGQLDGRPDDSEGDFTVYVNWGNNAGWTTGKVKYDSTSSDGSAATFQLLANLPAYDQPTQPDQPYHIVAYVTGPDGTSRSNYTDDAFVAANPDPVQVSMWAPDVTDANAAAEVPYTFQLAFYGQGGNLVSGSSVTGTTVQVQAPNGETLDATLTSKQLLGNTDGQGNAATITATYQITPLNGSWAAAPKGTYTVLLAGSPVTDLAGDTAPLGSAGTFNVNMAIKLIAGVGQFDTSVPVDGTFALHVSAVGATGATVPINGPAAVTINGKPAGTVNLTNGSGNATIPAGNQPGTDSVQVQVNTPVHLQAGVSVNVQASGPTSYIKDFLHGAAENAAAFASTLKDLLKDTFEDANAFEKAAIGAFKNLAKQLGNVAQGLNFAPLAFDLVTMWQDYNQGNQAEFAKDFTNATKDSLLLGVNYGLAIITETNPVGAAGGLVLNGIVSATAGGFFDNYLKAGFLTEGQNLFNALKGNGSSPLVNGGTAIAPGAGDPPPSVIFADPPAGTASAANLSAAGQAVVAATGTAFSGIVASFLDASGNTASAAYSASIAWGDGNFTAGTIAALPGGGFSVSGTNTYATPGIYTVTVVAVSTDGSTTASYATAVAYPAAPGGTAPAATLLAPDVNAQNADGLAPYTFAVAYQASGLIAAASLTGATVQVQPPTGAALTATVVGTQAVGSADALGDAATIVVTYQVMPPGGNWYAAPAGTYMVTLGGTPVTDRAGDAIAAGGLGSFQAAVPPTLAVSGLERIQVGTGAGIVNAASLTLGGNAWAGSTVTVFNHATALGNATAGADGSWTYPYTAPADGNYDFTATATLGGGTSAASADALVAVDTVAPTSTVAALPATVSSPAFAVSWSGHDDANGTGVAIYDVYVSDNGGAFTPWLTTTPLTTATYPGQPGHRYAFYSVATDVAGNCQPTPAGAEASTQVVLPAGFSYNAATQTLTISGGAASNTFSYSQATTPDDAGVPHTTFTFAIDGTVSSFPDTALAKVVVTATGSGNSAYLTANDTYVGVDGLTHETAEEAVLGGGAGQLYRGGTLFLTLSGFTQEYAFVGHADSGLIVGTAGPQNFFVSAGSYAYMTSGSGFYDVSGAQYVYADAANTYDVAYHYDGSGASALVISGTAYSFMIGTDKGQSFFNEAVGFQTNYGIAQHAGQDTAFFYDSPLNDVFVGNTGTSYLYSDHADGSYAEFDYTQGFALVNAYSFVGGTDDAYVYDTSVNHVTGFHRLV